ncbi:MAG: hypothetical protein JW748_00530 [Anaerolineales bacterium]|nr:hypothetical protein [Anaerolineales bacterium]
MLESLPSMIASHPAEKFLYLDPGTGSFLLQILIAAGMSVIFVLGVFRKKITAFFGRLFGKPPADPSQDGDSSDDD